VLHIYYITKTYFICTKFIKIFSKRSKRGRYPFLGLPLFLKLKSLHGFACVENNPVKATDYKYSSAMCHAGLVNNSLVTDYDIGVLPSEYQDYYNKNLFYLYKIYKNF
jgi:hypothetical protein